MSDAHGSADHSAHGHSGPVAWCVAAIVGIILGVVASSFLSFDAPASSTAAGQAIDAMRVVERLPDGTEVVLRGEGAKPAAPTGVGGAPAPAAAAPRVPLWACAPFAALLLGIALMPFVNARWWHAHYPSVSLFLAGLVAGFYFAELGGPGRAAMTHVGVEYLSFFALVGGLYVVSGGILVDIRVRGTPLRNAAILLVGAVIANFVGTTGASMLLIRPFMRINSPEHGGRGVHPLHIVFFIFIVSNCGGCLTPIGDPPLYLGYLKGVPFFWTTVHMWPMWLFVNAVLLAMFVAVDTWLRTRGSLSDRAGQSAVAADQPGLAGADLVKPAVRVIGGSGLVCLVLIVGCVFIDPLLKKYAGIEHIPIGAACQIAVAIAAYFLAPRHVHQANHFNFDPVKEVGLLFAGIFVAMAPALAYLDQNASSLGLVTPTQFYFATGVLSAGLDNAPTYLSFLQIAFSTLGITLTQEELLRFIDGGFTLTRVATGEVISFDGRVMLEAISQGAVFFGAMTYIGNGPNFMVKAIAESAGGPGRGVKMPSFFGYVILAVVFLGPVLLANWWIFIR